MTARRNRASDLQFVRHRTTIGKLLRKEGDRFVCTRSHAMGSDNVRKSFFYCAFWFLMLGSSSMLRGDMLLTYSVGNSLTYDIQYASGLDDLSVGESSPMLSGYHIRCARPLSYIVQNPADVCVPSARWGTYQNAFSTTALDVVTLQPFYGATIRSEVNAARQLVQELRANPSNQSTRNLFSTVSKRVGGLCNRSAACPNRRAWC